MYSNTVYLIYLFKIDVRIVYILLFDIISLNNVSCFVFSYVVHTILIKHNEPTLI